MFMLYRAVGGARRQLRRAPSVLRLACLATAILAGHRVPFFLSAVFGARHCSKLVLSHIWQHPEPYKSFSQGIETLGNPRPLEGTKGATSVNVQLLRLRKDLCMGSISQDIVNLHSELCSRRSGVFVESVRLMPPDIASCYVTCACMSWYDTAYDSSWFG